MPKEPSYYAILGLQPDADAAAIDAAYRGRSLRFRVGQPRTPRVEQSGPNQEQIEQAYAILGDPESRALYDAVYFPDKQGSATRRRRVPVWLWAIVGVWIVALLAILILGLRSRTQTDGGAIGRIAGQTATVVAAGTGGGAATSGTGSGISSSSSPTIAAALPAASATSTAAGAPATQATASAVTGAVAPTAATSAASSTAMVGPTRTTAPTVTRQPTNTATVQPPTATVPPMATAVPPTDVPPTEPPPVVAPEPTSEPEPTATPSFRPTDRIGTSLSVNLRSGPGVNYPSLGLLPTGTLLHATGETATVGGQLWRRFVLQDGRVGWVRDLDVFSTR